MLLPPLRQENEHGLSVLGIKPKFQIGHRGVRGRMQAALTGILEEAGAYPFLNSIAS